MRTTTALPAAGQAITAMFRVATPEISTFDLSTIEDADLWLTEVGGPNVGEPIWGLVSWEEVA